jgi:hypothetical protein
MKIQRLFCVVLLVVLAGCGKPDREIAPVTGHVTLDGQPLGMADLTFQSADGKSPAVARADENGNYELMFKRGQPGGVVGKNTVRITVSKEVVRKAPTIPAKYNTNTELVREITSGKNQIDFDLKSDEK